MKSINLIFLNLLLIASPAQAIDYFVGTLAQCEAYIAKMDAMMGYPNPATKTDTYAKPVKHEGRADTFMVPIKSVWAPKLNRQAFVSDIDAVSSVAERTTKRIARENLEAEKAFQILVNPVEKE